MCSAAKGRCAVQIKQSALCSHCARTEGVLLYFQIVQKPNKEMPRLPGIIKAQSGKSGTESPKTSEASFPKCPCRQKSLRVLFAKAEHSRPNKKLSPGSMRGNSQSGGQTTKSLLKQAAMFRGSYPAGSVAFLLLSTTLPAFCCKKWPSAIE